MTALPSLIKRLEEAAEGSRELDAEITLATGWKYEFTAFDEVECWRNPEGKAWYLPKYTESLDAAVALAERLLPVHRLDICMDPSGETAKIVWWPKGLTENEYTIKAEGLGWTAAISICLATLRALLAQETEKA